MDGWMDGDEARTDRHGGKVETGERWFARRCTHFRNIHAGKRRGLLYTLCSKQRD